MTGNKSDRRKAMGIWYLIIFTICWITCFVLAMAWCTRAPAKDGNEGFEQKNLQGHSWHNAQLDEAQYK